MYGDPIIDEKADRKDRSKGWAVFPEEESNALIDLEYARFRASIRSDIARDVASIAELFQELSEGTTGPALRDKRDFLLSCNAATLVPHLVMEYRAGAQDDKEDTQETSYTIDAWKDRCLGRNSVLVLPSDWLRVAMSHRADERAIKRKDEVIRARTTRSSRIEEWVSVLSHSNPEATEGDDEEYDRNLSAAFSSSGFDSECSTPAEPLYISKSGLDSYAEDREVDPFLGFAELFRSAKQRSVSTPGAATEYFAKVSAIFFRVEDSIDEWTTELVPSREDFHEGTEGTRETLTADAKSALKKKANDLIEGLFKRLGLDSNPPEAIIIPQTLKVLETT